MRMKQPVQKGHATKTVTIDLEGEANPSKLALFQFACSVAGETPSSLFGYNVSFVEDGTTGERVGVVSLYTD